MTDVTFHGKEEIIDHRYEIVDFIGSGGMAQIYRVRDIKQDSTKALKLLVPSTEFEHLVTRFQREFLTLVKMKHPNIVTVYDYGKDRNDSPYYTMEYLQGEYLGTSPGSRETVQFIKYFIQLLQTLQFIHSKGLVHGDIKPQNILIGQDAQVRPGCLACKPQQGPPGTSEKDQCPDHGKGAKDKSHNGCRSSPRAKLLESISGNERSEHKAYDFGSQVLDHGRPVQAEGARDVPFETGHTDAHIAGVAPLLE